MSGQRPISTMPWLDGEHTWISAGALAVLEYGDSLPNVHRQLHACGIQIYARKCHVCEKPMWQEIAGIDYVCENPDCKARQSHDGNWRTFNWSVKKINVKRYQGKIEDEQ